MKKLLSVVLALALCLTAMMGCFAVSAETVATSATINIAGGEAIKAGETATVTVTGSDFTDVCAADLVITLPAGFELVSVSEAGEVLVNDENGVYYVYDETANTVKYIDVFNFNDEVKALDLALVVTAPADAEDGEYAVTGAVVAANIDEEFLGVTINNGAITVQNEVACEHVWGDLEYEVVADGSQYGACVTKRACTACGEYEVVSTLANLKFGHNPVYESSLTLKFRLPADTATVEYLKGFSNIEAVFTKEMFDGNTPTTPAVTTIPGTLVPNATRTEFIYNEIRSVDLNSRIDCHVYGMNSDGYKVLIAHENYSFVDYIKTALASSGYANATAGTKNYYARQLVLDIAKYAAAAQEKFKYNTENLATDGIDLTYASPEITEFTGTLTATGAQFWRAPVFESQIFVNIRFLKSVATEGSYVTVQYPTVDGSYLEYDVAYEDFVTQPGNAARWQFEHKELNAATLTNEFFLTLYDADGNELGACNYSMEIYAQQAIAAASSTDADKALVKALVAYGRSANIYFNF